MVRRPLRSMPFFTGSGRECAGSRRHPRGLIAEALFWSSFAARVSTLFPKLVLQNLWILIALKFYKGVPS